MNFLKAVTGIGKQPSKFKQLFTPQQRWRKHLNIVKTNPQYISVVIQKSQEFKSNMKQKAYILIGLDRKCSIHELILNIRRQLSISDKQTLILSCNNIIPNQSQKIKNLQRFAQSDGFIYFHISNMQSFGV